MKEYLTVLVGLAAAAALGCSDKSSTELAKGQVVDSAELVFNVEGLT